MSRADSLLIAGRQPETLRLTGWDTGYTAVSTCILHPNQVAYYFYRLSIFWWEWGKLGSSLKPAIRVVPWLDATNDCRLIELPLLLESALSSRGRKERSLFEEIIFAICCRRQKAIAAGRSCKESLASKRDFFSPNNSWSQKQSNCRQHICILNVSKSVPKLLLRFCNEAARNILLK